MCRGRRAGSAPRRECRSPAWRGAPAARAQPDERSVLDKGPTVTACPIALSDINGDFPEGGQALVQGQKDTGGGEKEEKSLRIPMEQ